MQYTLLINGASTSVDVDPDTPLLWVLRDHLNLTGTKFGCGVGQCGACTVHLDGQATRSCQWIVRDVGTKAITTIEGLSADDFDVFEDGKRVPGALPAAEIEKHLVVASGAKN